MITNDLAVIGIDSQFDEFTDIDRVARALYLGTNTCSKNDSESDDESDTDTEAIKFCAALSGDNINTVIHDASLRMLNGISASINIIVISSQTLELNKILVAPKHSNSLTLVAELSEALSLANEFINAGGFVALIGIELGAKFNTKLGVEFGDDNDQPVSQLDMNQTAMAQLNNTISFDKTFDHSFDNSLSNSSLGNYASTSGYAGVLLAAKSQAINDNLPIYATINNCTSSSVNAEAMKQAVHDSLTNISVQNISHVEVSALVDDKHNNLETTVLIDAYGTIPSIAPSTAPFTAPLTNAISCVKSIVGESGGFSQVLGLLRSVIAIQQRYIPGINGWQSPKLEHLSKWQSSSFYFPTESRPCYPNKDGSKHSAAYSCLTENAYCHMVLSEHTVDASKNGSIIESDNDNTNAREVRVNGHLANSDLKLVLITGNDEAELQQQLLDVSVLTKTENLKKITDQQYQGYLDRESRESTDKVFTAVLLADSIDTLNKEITLAQQGISEAFINLAETGQNSRKTHWQTPKGSYFSANPVCINNSENRSGQKRDNNICFMYPGIGATYLGLGRDLFQLFPDIYPEVVRLADDIGSSLKDSLLNPRSITRLDFNELKQRDLALRGNLADIAEAGVAFACVFTQIFTKVFKINADFATGYSMGEVSMYAALGCWQQPGLMSARLANSATFNERLSGNLLTLRDDWSIPLKPTHSDITKKPKLPIWETYTIKATLAEVEAACIGESRVYCTIINTPDSLLIGGYPEDCLRVINKLGVRAMPLNMANAIHSEPAKAEYEAMVGLYTMAVNERISTKMYSSSCYLPIPQLSKAIANSIAKCLCDRVDFPRLVNTLYDNGARVFIEMGPGRSLCSWVDKTLFDDRTSEQDIAHQENSLYNNGSTPFNSKNSLTVPVNAKGVSDELTYFRAIAKLISHGIKLDLNTFFSGSIIINKTN